MISSVSCWPPKAKSRVYTTLRLRSTLKVVLLAPKSTTAMVRSMPPSGIWCVISLQAFSSANASTSTIFAVSPAALTAAWRCSTFSVRVATSSTSLRLGILLGGPEHLEVVADLVHREGDVLVGLHFDLRLEVAGAQRARHLDDLGDGGIAADRHGHLACSWRRRA